MTQVYDGQADRRLTVDETPSRVRRWWPVVLQVIGVVLVGTGFGLVEVWLGVVAAGLGCLLFGIAQEISLLRRD